LAANFVAVVTSNVSTQRRNVRISLKDAVHLFKEWKDSASLINVTLALEDKLDRFDAVICAVSPFGRLMFLPTKGSRRVVNLRKADFRRVDVGNTAWDVFVVAFLKRGLTTRGFVTLAKRR
jgi:hypothetical protein